MNNTFLLQQREWRYSVVLNISSLNEVAHFEKIFNDETFNPRMYKVIGRNKFEPSFPNIKWDFGCACVYQF